MEGTKINKITVAIAKDCTYISLYRTNIKIGEILNKDLELPTFADSGLPNQMIYMNYCRDFVINLLTNGGIEGYFYEEKEQSESMSKYGKVEFISKSIADIKEVVGELASNIAAMDENTVIEQYKDMYIKNARTEFLVKLKCGKSFIVPCEIKSGQACKPKEMIYDGLTMKFNITNVKTIIK